MTKALFLVTALGIAATGCSDPTWSGTISDSLCATTHMWDEHDPTIDERTCTLMCVMNGQRFVFLSEDRVYGIQNQDHPGLAEQAGRQVLLTGRMQDDQITVSGVRPR